MTINYNGTIKSLRDIVWGVVTNPLSQIEQITLLIFIKLLSERHNELERMKSKKLIFTGDFASYHFDSLSRLAGYELVDTTRKAIESLYKNPNIEEPIRRLYERSYLQVNDPRVLSLLINEINKIDITHIDMGDFYEHLLAVLGTQKEAGQFRTPRHLIKFIVDVVDPQIGERVIDPACGTAGFLTASYIHIRNNSTTKEAKKADAFLDKLNLDQKTFLLNKTIYGYDIDPNMIKFAISNLYLHNIKNPNISQHNTLTSNDGWEERYDVILTNPPFSTPKGGVKPTDRFTLNSKRTEVLFVEYIIEHLTLNGRAGVIVPEGIIFKSDKAYKELRKWLVEDNYLYAVVSLPAGVFNPYSGVKTSILFLDRELARQTDKILFCKVENDGFDLGAQRRPIDKNDLPEVLKVIKNFQTNPKRKIEKEFYWTVEEKKIVESGDYNLSGERYRETISIKDQKWPMMKLGDIVEVLDKLRRPVKKADRKYGSYPYYGATGILDYIDNYIFDERLVLVGEDGAKWGADEKTAFIAEGKYWVNNHAHVLRPNKSKLIDTLLVYLLNHTDLRRYITGVTVPKLNQQKLRSIKIPLPPLSIQQQIVDKLDCYQKIIDGAKQVIDNYKPSFKIDPDWKVVELGKILSIKRGGSPRPIKDYITDDKNGINWIKIGDTKGIAKYIYKTKEKIKPEGLKKSRLVKEGDFILSNSMSFGKPYIMKTTGCIHDGWLLLRIINKSLNKDYLYYILSSGFIYEKFKKSATGSSVNNLNINLVKKVSIPIPPLEIQREIISKIEDEEKLVEANKKLIQLFEQKIKDKIEEVWQ